MNLDFTLKIPPEALNNDWLNILFDTQLEQYFKLRGEWISTFMLLKYGTCDNEECKQIIQKKRLAICTNTDNDFFGIVANNRWLYTIDGYIVGKKGKNFDFNNPKGRWMKLINE